MRRLIVHIGLPKSASTTIQRALHRSRKRLGEAGILYPKLTDDAYLHHLSLSLALDRRGAWVPLREQMRRLSQQVDDRKDPVVLMSYEGWTYRSGARKAARLFTRFAEEHGLSLEAVMVLRPQPNFLNSLYAHRVSRFKEDRLCSGFVDWAFTQPEFGTARGFGPWEDTGAKLTAIPLIERPGENIVRRFLEDTGIAPRLDEELIGRMATAGSANEANDPYVVEVSRRAVGIAGRDSIPYVFQGGGGKAIAEACAAEGWKGPRFQGLDEQLVARIEDRYRAENDAFAQRHWGRTWDAVFQGAGRPTRPANALVPAEIPADISRRMDAIATDVARRYGRSGTRTLFARVRSFLGLSARPAKARAAQAGEKPARQGRKAKADKR